MLLPTIGSNLPEPKSNNKTLSIRHNIYIYINFKENGSITRKVGEGLTGENNNNPLEAFAGQWKMAIQEIIIIFYKSIIILGHGFFARQVYLKNF